MQLNSSTEPLSKTTKSNPLSAPHFLRRAKARFPWFKSTSADHFKVLNRRSWEGDRFEPVRTASEPKPDTSPLSRISPDPLRVNPQPTTSKEVSASNRVGERMHKMKHWLYLHWAGSTMSTQVNHDREKDLDELTFSNTLINGRTTAVVSSPPGAHDALSLTEQPIPWEIPGDVFRSPIILPEATSEETPVGGLEAECVYLNLGEEPVKGDSGMNESRWVNSWSGSDLMASEVSQTTPDRVSTRAPGDVVQPLLRSELPGAIPSRDGFQRWRIPSLERIYSANGWDSPLQLSKRPLSIAASNRLSLAEGSALKHSGELGHLKPRKSCRSQVQFVDNALQFMHPPSSVGVDRTPVDSVESFLTRPTKVLSTARFRVRQSAIEESYSTERSTNGHSPKLRLRLRGRSYSLRSPLTSVLVSSGRISRRIRQRARTHRSYLSFWAVGSAIRRRRPSSTGKHTSSSSSQSFDQLLGFLDACDEQPPNSTCRGSTKSKGSTSRPESYASGETTSRPRLPCLHFTPTFSGRIKMWGLDINKSSRTERFSSELRSSPRKETSIDVFDQLRDQGGKELSPAKGDSPHELHLSKLSPGVFSSSCMAHASSTIVSSESLSPTRGVNAIQDNKPKPSFASRIQYKLRYPTGPPNTTSKPIERSYHQMRSTSSTADSSVTPVAASPRLTALSDKDCLNSPLSAPLSPLTFSREGKYHCANGSAELPIGESEISTLATRSPPVKKRTSWFARRSQPRHRQRHPPVQSTESTATNHSSSGTSVLMLPSSYDGGQDIRGYPVVSPTAVDINFTGLEPTQQATSHSPVCMYKDENDFVCVQSVPKLSKRRFSRPRRPSTTSLLSHRASLDTAEAPAHQRTAKFLRLVSQWAQLISPRTQPRSVSPKANPAVSNARERPAHWRQRPVSVASSQGVPKSTVCNPNSDRSSFSAKRSSYPYFHLVGFPPCFMAVLPKTPLTQHNSRMSCLY
ncbi:hypothetical protein IWQ61_007518 [Dispira simplex]|nr:hypothetical protein IWQ61_007518 [Dispira simplex]